MPFVDPTHMHYQTQILKDNTHDPIDTGGGSISVTDGTTTVNPATSIRTPRTVVDLGSGEAYLGGTVVVSTTDPGAIGAFNLWLETVFANDAGDGGYGRLWVRNSTDTGWNSGSPMTYSTSTDTLVSSPDDYAELSLASDGHDSYLSSARKLDLKGSGGLYISIDPSAEHIALVGAPIEIGASGPTLQSGTVDPSAGAGVAATLGSMYFKSDGYVFWKSAAPNTGWTGLPLIPTGLPISIQGAGIALNSIGGLLSFGSDGGIQVLGALQTIDPQVAGSWWSNAGVVTVSAG